MIAEKTFKSLAHSPSQLMVIAWVGTLLTSFLINICWIELFSGDMLTGFYIRIGFTLALLLLSYLWPASSPLRRYWWTILALVAADLSATYMMASPAWNAFFASDASWFVTALGQQLPRLLLTVFTWLALIFMGMKRKDYFLTMGDLDASSEPIRWLGEKQSKPWTRYGRQWAVMIFIVTLIVLGLGVRPSMDSLVRMVPVLPAILLFAALNSFNENFSSRAALLPHILPWLGKQQALLMTALFFGLGHFYGIPPGIGAILPTFLGWLSAKAMVETKGFFWSWMIQFPLDIIVFTIFALQVVLE